MAKNKALTQREKRERAALKKKFQADGILPPDKPRLNRKKFAEQTIAEFKALDMHTALLRLHEATLYLVGPGMQTVSLEQVGILKAMKIAVETERFMQALEAEGRTQCTFEEYFKTVVFPIEQL